MEPRPCERCGREFVPERSRRRFCGKSCSGRHNADRSAERSRLDGTFYERHADRVKEAARTRYATDPEFRKRALARAAARRAFPDPKPCSRCGKPNADRHHDDYDKPLDIRWLCRSCHVNEHVDDYGTWGEGFRVS